MSRVPTEEYKNNFDAIFRKARLAVKEDFKYYHQVMDNELNSRCTKCDFMNKMSDAVCKNCGESL